MGSRDVQSAIHFLKPNSLYRHEKPYAFRFELSSDDIPQSNMEMQKIEPINITDIRGSERDYSLDVNGFTIVRFESSLEYQDFYDPEKVKIYLGELEELLKSYLKASEVKVFRHGIPLPMKKSKKSDANTAKTHQNYSTNAINGLST
ncbi:MAG: hypothetical protein Q9170_004505 [Blastenia crenularia]